MQVDHHSLSSEFPEFNNQIHELKQSDAHFSRLFAEYDDADKAINRAENGVDNLSDAALETLKKVRVSLKDQLFLLLQAAKA